MSNSGSFFVVDDHDTESINYETLNLWFPTLLNGANNGTITAGVAGAKATFTFSGSEIAVYGIATSVPNVGPPAVQFSLDGQDLTTTTAPNNGSTAIQYPFLIVDGLNSSQHVLQMNVVNATTQYPFAFDGIIYKPENNASPTASQSVVTTTFPHETGVISEGSSGHSSTPVGAIVGGVVGGIALIAVACFATWFLCFRRRKSNGQPYFGPKSGGHADLLEQESKATPYEIRPQSVAAPSSFTHESQNNFSATSPPATAAYAAGLYQPHSEYPMHEGAMSECSAGSSSSPHSPPLHVNTRPATCSPNQQRSKAAQAGMLSVPQEARYHADSGMRFDENGQPQVDGPSNVVATHDLAEVPPSYSAE